MIVDEEVLDEITLEEDIFFSKLADKRLAETKYCVKHEDVWDLASSPSLRATERSVAIYKNNKKC